jgi:hypothetical protein
MPTLLCLCWQAFKASMGDKAKGVSDDMLNMLAGQQMVSEGPGITGFGGGGGCSSCSDRSTAS